MVSLRCVLNGNVCIANEITVKLYLYTVIYKTDLSGQCNRYRVPVYYITRINDNMHQITYTFKQNALVRTLEKTSGDVVYSVSRDSVAAAAKYHRHVDIIK